MVCMCRVPTSPATVAPQGLRGPFFALEVRKSLPRCTRLSLVSRVHLLPCGPVNIQVDRARLLEVRRDGAFLALLASPTALTDSLRGLRMFLAEAFIAGRF